MLKIWNLVTLCWSFCRETGSICDRDCGALYRRRTRRIRQSPSQSLATRGYPHRSYGIGGNHLRSISAVWKELGSLAGACLDGAPRRDQLSSDNPGSDPSMLSNRDRLGIVPFSRREAESIAGLGTDAKAPKHFLPNS